MNILASQYSLEHKSLEIFIAGCRGNPHCNECHNKESWNFNQGDLYNEQYFNNIKEKVELFSNLIDNIFIFGGEPLDQNKDELIHFLVDMKSLNKKVWLFTRYEYDEVYDEVIKLCDYIKCGIYDKDLKVENNIHYNIKLASSNQYIIKTMEGRII